MSGCISDTTTVDLTVSGGVLSADVKISGDPGNQLSVHADGLYSSGAPSGAVIMYAGGAAPAGWLLCDGSNVSRTTYAQLFSEIGTSYGVGDGTTTFTLPDCRGRVPVGVGTHADVNALNKNDGLGVGVRTPIHNSVDSINFTDSGHYMNWHGADASNTGARSQSVDPADGTNFFGTEVTPHSTQWAQFANLVKSGSVGPGGSRPTDMPAFVTFTAIIKT